MSPNDNYRNFGGAGVGGVGMTGYDGQVYGGAGVNGPANPTLVTITNIPDLVINIQKDMCNVEELVDMLTNKLMPVLNISPIQQVDDIYPVTSNSPIASDLIHIHQRLANVIKRMYELRDDIQL